MQMNEILASDYKKRLDSLGVNLKEKEEKMKDLEKTFEDLKKKSGEKLLYSVEPKFDGEDVSVYKKGNVVRFFPENSETKKLQEELKEAVLSLSKKDFIITGQICLTEDNNPIFFVSDCLYHENEIHTFPWKERKKILETLSFSEKIKQNGSFTIDNEIDTKKAIDLFEKTKGTKGIVFKNYSKSYFSSEQGNFSTYYYKQS